MSILDVDDFKDFLEIPGTGRDTAANLVVAGVNAFIERKTHRDWSRSQRDEWYRGSGTKALTLQHYPIASVATISEDGASIDATDTDEVEIDERNGILWRVGGSWLAVEEWIYRITYTAGPKRPPADLRLAALELAGWVWRRRGGAQSKSAGDERLGLYEKAIREMPLVAEAITAHRDPSRRFLLVRDA